MVVVAVCVDCKLSIQLLTAIELFLLSDRGELSYSVIAEVQRGVVNKQRLRCDVAAGGVVASTQG